MKYVADRSHQKGQRKRWDDRRGLKLLQEYRRTGDPALLELVFLEYRGLAAACAQRFEGQGADFDDLYQEACMGILKAIELFEPGEGTRFSTYAAYFAEGNIRRLLRECSGPCRVPRRARERTVRIRRLGDELGHDPSAAEILEYGVVSPEHIDDSLAAIAVMNPGLFFRADGTGLTGEVSRATAYTDPGLTSAPLRLDVQRAIDARLTPREAQVVRMRFDEDLPQREIAQRMGSYQMKVSRILKKSLDKLRDELAEEGVE
ncbi:MAG: sigma-70 family RNA polymerase sigma factor [Coriobacteriales bacterium]